ncbi:hypothetical protein [Rhizobium sp. Leaf386]|uniref:hypothetical protein n=1 Tax=Rhizobium sp. Leaf386 TaxID=1736359 RepID=UPI000712580F|nr:hypothetical protein [Rhizobium sp. Leaf386]KQT05247.1 hypothetical protein ASG50_15280 [Rhizobium sp. Leaf386]
MLGLNLGLNLGSAALRAGAGVPWITPSTIVAEAGSGIGGAGQWRPSNAGTQTMTIDSGFTRRPGVPTLKIDASVLSPTGSYFTTFRKALSQAIALTGAQEAWVWMTPTTAGGHTIFSRVGSDAPADPPTASPANRLEQQFSNDKFQSGYWTNLYWHPNGEVYSNAQPDGVPPTPTGTPDLNNIREIEFAWNIGSATPAAERVMWLDLVAFNGRSRPAVIFGFDGFGDTSHESVVLPLCQSLGLRGYIAGDGNAAAANAAKLATFRAAGWDIISQGMDHTNYLTNPGDLSPDFDEAKGILEALSLTGALDIFAYPFNSRSLATDATLLGKGVKWARTTGGNRFPITSLGKPNPLLIGAVDMGGKSAAQIKAWIDDAKLGGYTLVLYDHTPNEAVLIEVMNYIATNRNAGLLENWVPSQHARMAA